MFQPSISPDGTKLRYTLSTEGSALPNSALVVTAPLSAPSAITIIADSATTGDYNCTWSPDGFFIAYVEGFAGPAEIFTENADGSRDPHPLDQCPHGVRRQPRLGSRRPARVSRHHGHDRREHAGDLPGRLHGHGAGVRANGRKEFEGTDPANGTVTQNLAGDPFTYTPNQGFTGTDSFEVRSFDEFGFRIDRGTVTITVRAGPGQPPPPPPPTASCGGQTATIVGTVGADTLFGTARRDVIAALGGNDTVRGGRGRDVICGSSGRDRIGGGSGNDGIGGGSEGDRLAGNGGRDRVSGNGGSDAVNGGSGSDALRGNSGRDRLGGGPGGDRLNGGAGRDRCVGGRGSDRASCESLATIP